MITQILEMLFAKPLVPYIELYIIYVLIRHFYEIFKDLTSESDIRRTIKEDLEKLKLTLNKKD